MVYTENKLNAMHTEDVYDICKKWDIKDRSAIRTKDAYIKLVLAHDNNKVKGRKSAKANVSDSGSESDDERPTMSTTSSKKLEAAFAKLNTMTKVEDFVKEADFPDARKDPKSAIANTPTFGEITSKTDALKLVRGESHTAPVEEYAMELLSEREILRAINKITAPVAAPAKSRVTTSAVKSSSKRSGGSEATSRRRA
jgi:hypothetical protein